MPDSPVFDKEHFIEVLEALHRDQTGLAKALNAVLDVLDSYSWLAEGSRGSYEWDDDDYYKEIGRCFDAISEVCELALRRSGESHQICCDKYRHVGLFPRAAVQRRIRMGQTFPQFADELMDFALIEGEQ
jgi:hypothetical protein